MLTVSATDLGTPEAVWLTDRSLAEAPPLDLRSLVAGCDRVVVLAPHPDDEILGAGGLIQAAARMGRRVAIVAVTDGEASHPGSQWTGERMAARRRRESVTALRRLGHAAEVCRVAIPDGRVQEHEHVLTDRLVDLLGPADLCVTTWRDDGHPYHDATGRDAAAANLVGLQAVADPRDNAVARPLVRECRALLVILWVDQQVPVAVVL